MKDFKTLPKMKTGGRVKKYETGGKVDSNSIEYWSNKRSPESKAAADQRMADYKEGVTKSSSQFKENMSNIGKDYDAKIAEAKVKYAPTKGVGGAGSSGTGGAAEIKTLQNPRAIKTGGRVTKKVGTVKKNK
jgi:hypothetical protein